jgi:chlorite dismutase
MTKEIAQAPFIHVLALGLESAWRRLPYEQRCSDARAFIEAERAAAEDGVSSVAYSSIGLEPGVDILFWRSGASVDALERAASRVLRSGLGTYTSARHSFLAQLGSSQYVTKPSEQEQGLFSGERARYLVVYPFTKAADWYLLSREARQGVMNEHMRVGRRFPQVRQALGYSFGLDDQDFLVAYETDDLVAFGELVRALRATESRRSTVRDTPLLLGVHRPLEEIVELLGGGAE